MIAPKFHAHLDVCQRCEEQPFNLCPEGERLLREAVGEHVEVKVGGPVAKAIALEVLALATRPALTQPDGDPGYNDEPWERT